MPQEYIVEVSSWPQEFTVTANNPEEAKRKAQELFSEKNNGQSAYETIILEIN